MGDPLCNGELLGTATVLTGVEDIFEGTRKTKIRQILREYAQLSSTHAVGHIGEAHTYRLAPLPTLEKSRTPKRRKQFEE